jgi:phage head maturation protease
MIVSEVSIVTFPAYPATDVQVAQRSLQAFQQSGASRLDMLARELQMKRAR